MLQICYSILGIPRCSRQIVREEFVTQNVPKSELQFYESINEDLQITQILFIGWLSCWLMKGIYYIVYMLNAISSIKSIAADNGSLMTDSGLGDARIHLGCLQTNCTRLSANRPLQEDLLELPLFAICHPNLMQIYVPIIGLQAIGLNIYTVVMYFVLLFCIMGLRYYIRKPFQESCLFPVTPICLARTKCKQIQGYLVETLSSMKHYYDNLDCYSEYLFKMRLNKVGRLASFGFGTKPDSTQRERSAVAYLSTEMLSLDYLKFPLHRLDLGVQDYINDCLPLARVQEWSLKGAEDFLLIAASTFLILASSFGLGIYGLTLFEDYVKEDLRKISNYAHSTGCKFWKVVDGRNVNYIDVGNTATPSRLVYLFDYITLLTPGFYIVGVNVALTMCNIEELNFILDEQISSVRLACLFAGLLKTNSSLENNTRSNGTELWSGRGCFKMSSTRQLFELESKFPFKHIKLADDQHSTRMIIQHYKHPNFSSAQLDSFVDLMTKIYINNRLVKDMAAKATEVISIPISFSYVASYGSIVIATSMNRILSSPNFAPIVLAGVGLLLTNSLVLNCARVYSTTNCLVQKMWQTIAATGTFTDLRVRHIRRLWIKQVLVLSQQGTLKVTTFGLPVTYASLIEALIWTSTIAIISFS